MQRALPLLVFLGLTVVAAGTALGLNTILGSMVAPSAEDLTAASATEGAGSANGSNLVAERSAPRARVQSEREYLNTIMGRNIFDPDAIAEWNPSAAGAGGSGQAITDLKVRLVGTMVAEPEKYSAAFIVNENEKDSEALGYSIGHKIQDAEIIGIEDLKVTLKRGDGKIEVLTASEEKPSSSRPAPTSGGSDGDGEVEKVGDNEFVVDRSLIDEYTSDLSQISKMGRALLHRGPDGEFDGYRLSAIRRNTLADQLGIKNGDIIHSVNGQPLNSVQNAMGAYQGLQSESELTFEVTRRGQPVTLKYRIQ